MNQKGLSAELSATVETGIAKYPVEIYFLPRG